jgi:hypothetical protein
LIRVDLPADDDDDSIQIDSILPTCQLAFLRRFYVMSHTIEVINPDSRLIVSRSTVGYFRREVPDAEVEKVSSRD